MALREHWLRERGCQDVDIEVSDEPSWRGRPSQRLRVRSRRGGPQVALAEPGESGVMLG